MSDILQLLQDAGLATDDQALQKLRYAKAQKDAATEQPDMLRGKRGTYAPSPVANIAATLSSVLGQRDSETALQSMAANFLRQQKALTAGKEGMLGGQIQPRQAEVMFAGTPPTQALANAGKDIGASQEKVAMDAARRANVRGIADQAAALKLTLGLGDQAVKREGIMPFSNTGTPLTGTVKTNKKTGEQTVTQPVAKPINPDAPGPKPKILAYSEVKDIQGLNTELSSLNDIEKNFQDSYSGKGPLGATLVKAKKMLGSSASPEAQKEAAYWADYQRLVDIPQRHEKFGSALTPGESRIWESARNIGPNSDPKIVRQAISSMKGILSRHLDSWKESREAAGYGAGQLDPLVKANKPATPGGVKKYNPATDSFE
jgi:hypothetical protein